MDVSMTESTMSTTLMSQRTQVPPYVSCIQIDGRPILPPLMTQERRKQMNHYKQLAMALEQKKRKKNETTFTMPDHASESNLDEPLPQGQTHDESDLLKFVSNHNQCQPNVNDDHDEPIFTSTPIRPNHNLSSSISPASTPLISRSGTRIYFDQSTMDDDEGEKNKTTIEAGHTESEISAAAGTITPSSQSPEKFGTTTLDDIDNNNKEVQLLVKRLSDINMNRYTCPVPVPVQKLIDVEEGHPQLPESKQLKPPSPVPLPLPTTNNDNNITKSAPPSGRKKKNYFDDSFDTITLINEPGTNEKHVHFPDAKGDNNAENDEEKDKENDDPASVSIDPMAQYEDHFTIRRAYFSNPTAADRKEKESSFESPKSLKSTHTITTVTSHETDSENEDNSFASLPSSTATFIISRAEEDPNSTKSSKKTDKSILSEQVLSEGEIIDDDSHHYHRLLSSGSESDDEWSNLNSSYTSVTTTAPSTATLTTETPLGRVGLAQLHSRFKEFSPSFYKTSEGMSPLLKGVIFSEPLNRREIFRLPPKVFDPTMAPKFERLTATAKGFLVRRLLRTEKVQNIIQTIRDTVELLLKLYDEAPTNSRGETQVKAEDKDLNTRLMQQLHAACNSFHNVFFKLSSKERMAIISTDRNKIRAKAIKEAFGGDPRTKSQREQGLSSSRRNISKATVKSLQRRITMSNSQQLRTPIGTSKLGRPAPATIVRMGQGTSRTITTIPTLDLNRRISTKPKSSSNLRSSHSRESLSSSNVGIGNRTFNSNNSYSSNKSGFGVSSPTIKKRSGSSTRIVVDRRNSTFTRRAWK